MMEGPSLPTADIVGGMMGGMDAKSALNQYCHRYCSRPVTKADIVYSKKILGGNQFQATVTLNCMDGAEYAGEVCSTGKEAEKSAAHQALEACKELALPETMSRSKKKRKKNNPVAVADPESCNAGPGEAPESAGNLAMTDKVRLNTAYMRIAGRPLQKGETIYDCNRLSVNNLQQGYVATVQLTVLPGEWAERSFKGEVCSNKAGAEQSAAGAALAEILADPELGALVHGPAGAPRASPGPPRAPGPSANVSRKVLTRERLTEEPVIGEVLEWKGTHGWIKPNEEPDHPAASWRGGRIYVGHEDLIGDASELQPGTQVQFLLYSDISGLGAEQVTLI